MATGTLPTTGLSPLLALCGTREACHDGPHLPGGAPPTGDAAHPQEAPMHAARPHALALSGLMLLAACSAGSPEETAEPTEPTAEASAEETPDEAAEQSGGGGAACLEGTWDMDVDAIKEAILAAPAAGGVEATVDVTGESGITFDGQTMTTLYRGYVVTMTIDLEGQAVIVTVTSDGTVVGGYTATDTELVVADVDASGLVTTTTTTLDGEAVEIPGVGDADLYDLDLGGTSTYTCTATDLTLVPQVEGAEAFEQRLVRR